MKITAIIAAGGSGSRMGKSLNKVLLPLFDKTVIEHTVSALMPAADEIIISAKPDDMPAYKRIFYNSVIIVPGGATRQESVYNALKKASGDIVFIHDAARALISTNEVQKAIDACIKFGAAALGTPCTDTLKRADSDGFITETIDRENVFRIQTPQVFFKDKILSAHESAIKDGFSATDDCAIYEKYIGKVKIVPGSTKNIKITYPEDLMLAESILKSEKK